MSISPNTKQLICHGCLSISRNLQQLTNNTALYFSLLKNKTDTDGILDIFLCWECVALLEKVKCFQKRIQKAQQYLQEHSTNLEKLISNQKCLSDLNIVNDHVVISTYCMNDEEKSIKQELETETEEKVCLEENTKIKEEQFEDISSIIDSFNDTDLYTNYDDVADSTCNYVKEELINQECKQRVVSKKSKNKSMKSYKSFLEKSKIDIYISKIICSLDILQKIKKEDVKSYKKLHLQVNNHRKKLGTMISKDITMLAKSKTQHACSFCNAEITSDTISSHYEEHHLVTYQCRLCRTICSSAERTKKHILERHEIVYTCPDCDQCFHLIKNLKKHIKFDHKCICDHCNKGFRNKMRLISHMRLMHLPDKCRICNVAYSTGERLRKHLQRVHVPRVTAGETCYCVECDKHYPHLRAYQAHLRSSVVHVPKRVYRIPCPECGLVYSKKTNMNNHYKLVHLKQTKHYCNICDKYYNNGYALRTHMLYVHEKAEKPRNKICDMCGRAFHNQKILTNHIRTHTGERPHECPHCPAAFGQRTAMVSHVRTQHKYFH